MAGLSGAELRAACGYLRVDEGSDDAAVMACVLGARAYLLGAGVSLPPEDTERRGLYDLVCHGLALGSYELRTPDLVGTTVAQNPQLRKSLNQLKFTEAGVPNLGTLPGGAAQ